MYMKLRSASQLDRLIKGGIILLIVLIPLTVDPGDPSAFSLLEAVIFLLVVVWMAKALLRKIQLPSLRDPVLRSVGLLALFIVLIIVQLVPLPPFLEHMVSPSTYQLYVKSLPGWPDKTPYAELVSGLQWRHDAKNELNPASAGRVLPRALSSGRPGTPKTGLHLPPSAPDWRPLSISPDVTLGLLLRFSGYVGLFLLVVFYPFDAAHNAQGERRFCRTVLIMVLLSGLLVATIGLVQCVTLSDEVSWTFVPQNWLRESGWGIRATGPFANPDHFANYPDLVLPLAVAGFLFPASIASRRYEVALRCLCGLAVLVLLSALIASSSRAGWIGVGIALLMLAWLFNFIPGERGPTPLGLAGWSRPLIATGLLGSVALALLIAGPLSRAQADARLKESLRSDDLVGRLMIAKDSVRMIRDFPLFGVGLGCWPDIFPRYKSPPWSSTYWNATHNDYVQLAAETGLLGAIALVGAFLSLGKCLYMRLKASSPRTLPIAAALLSGVGATAFHEFFDFPLHISANALLFTLFLAIALRITETREEAKPANLDRMNGRVFVCASVAVTALVLAFAALREHEEAVYPYDLKKPPSLAQLRAFILAHPADSRAHLMLIKLMGDRISFQRRLEESQVAVWLEPTNPLARDLYARTLFDDKQAVVALKQITRSVFFSPTAATHFYLMPDAILRLSIQERQAVEEGFRRAVAHGYLGALEGLGNFYAALGQFPKEANIYAGAAASEHDPETRDGYLINAGLASSQGGDWRKAESAFRDAAAAVPNDPRPYQYLTRLYGQKKDLVLPKVVVSQGRDRGAEPFLLYVSLAQVQQGAGDIAGAEGALLEALKYRPDNFDAAFNLNPA
jgi:O-antigen ligase